MSADAEYKINEWCSLNAGLYLGYGYASYLELENEDSVEISS